MVMLKSVSNDDEQAFSTVMLLIFQKLCTCICQTSLIMTLRARKFITNSSVLYHSIISSTLHVAAMYSYADLI